MKVGLCTESRTSCGTRWHGDASRCRPAETVARGISSQWREEKAALSVLEDSDISPALWAGERGAVVGELHRMCRAALAVREDFGGTGREPTSVVRVGKNAK